MISISRTRSMTVQYGDDSLVVEFSVPSALETEDVLLAQSKDSDIFKKFVTRISSENNEEDTVFPSKFLELPGSYKVLNEVSKAIVKSATLGEEEKN